MMKIRVEVSPTATNNASGVGHYTTHLVNALSEEPSTTVFASYYNFLNRQFNPIFNPNVVIEKNALIPLRVYAKLQSHQLIFPFDAFSSPVDLTIFTNYAHWPSVHTEYTATVIHDLTYIHHPELMEKNNLPHLQRVVPRALKESSFIITVSETIKKELVDTFAIDPSRVVVTPIPPDDQFGLKNNADVRTKYKIRTKKYILYLGNIEPRKDIPTLINAYRKLPEEIRDTYSLVVAGGLGWKSEEIQWALKDAKQDGFNVIQTGYIDQKDKSALYQQASIFVLPSVYEGFGMPILEAFASKTPVITTDLPVLREVGGDGALYYPAGDLSSLHKTLLGLIKNPAQQKDLIIRASKQLATFSWKDNVAKIISAVESLS